MNKRLLITIFCITVISSYVYGCWFKVHEYYCGVWLENENRECGKFKDDNTTDFWYEDFSVCSEYGHDTDPQYHPEWDRGRYEGVCVEHQEGN